MRQLEDLATMSTTQASAVPVPTLSVARAFARYEEIRDRLPEVAPGAEPGRVDGLLSIADRYDGFLFDSFGVLNVGETAIPGAAACLDALRAMGKRFCILTNAASYTSAEAHGKYQRLGLHVRPEEIVSSRDVTLAHLAARGGDRNWAAIAAEGDAFEDTEARVSDLLADEALWDSAEGFLFLSSARWTPALQDRLVAAVSARPRPVVVGNPDLVAPRETGLTVEPGYWAHNLQDRTGEAPVFFGKPYAEAFEIAEERLGGGRLAMIGDTLHTDILGGQGAGHDTVLVTDHGLLAGQPIDPFIAAAGIVPTWIMRSI
jgi:HAD superfamily hydrolase (TIGR01450 family)